jgi:tetratricopeptide (TPR) repeat protein
MKTKTGMMVSLLLVLSVAMAASAAGQAGRGVARMGGWVVDDEDKPVPSAKIVMSLLPEEQIKREATANKKGEWGIIGLGTGDWTITASAEGYLPQSMRVYVRQLEVNPRITMKLKKIQQGSGRVINDAASLGLLDEVTALYNDGKYTAAIVLSEQFLEKNPDAYQAYLAIADCYREMGDMDKAVDNYNLALEKAKEDQVVGKLVSARALAGIGGCYLKKEDLEQAKKFFEQSLEMSPENELLAYNVGEIYFSNQQIDEALRYFELAAQIKPGWSDPCLKLGYVYLNKGDSAKAVDYFEKFLSLEPDSERSAGVKEIIKQIKK